MATSTHDKPSVIQSLRTSIVAKIGGMFGLLALIYSVFLLVTSYMTGQLIGVTAAIDQAGTERMRVYKLATLILHLSPDSSSEKDRQAIREERARWERVLEGLRHGTADHGPVGEMDTGALRQLEELQMRWEQQLHPAIEVTLHASGPQLLYAQQQYLQQADEFVVAIARMVRTLEQHAAMRIKLLYGLQIVLLVLSIGLMGFAVVVLHREVRQPLGMLTQRAQRLVAGQLDGQISVHESDEVGELARTFEQVAESVRSNVQELDALHATGQEISSLGVGGLEQVLRRIVDRAADLVRTDLAVLLVRHPMMDCWVVEAASGKAFDTIRHQILLLEETPFANQTFESKRPVVVEDLTEHNDKRVRLRDEFGAKSYMGVPLLGPHDCIGILGLWNTTCVRRFTDRDMRAAQQFASYAAIAIENARLFDAVESESRELRSKLTSVERNVAELTHEVKAPAGRIAEFASWIEKDYGDRLDEKGLRYLSWIKKEGTDLAHLAERTLDLACLTQAPIPVESVNTQAVVREVVDLLWNEFASRSIRVDIAPDFPQLACRRIHLRQVLENLMSNAIKYMGSQKEPRIEIGWEEDPSGLVLFVHDNGVGIDQAMTEQIFLPFQRLATDGIPGAGIGLSIVKTVVELYGGRVWVKSRPGVGSTFYFHLPMLTRNKPQIEQQPEQVIL